MPSREKVNTSATAASTKERRALPPFTLAARRRYFRNCQASRLSMP